MVKATIKVYLLASAQYVIEELRHKTPLVTNCPGKAWYNASLKHHLNIGITKEQNLTSSKAAVKDCIR